MREKEYLKKFVAEYESLATIQSAMRRRMDEICVQGAAESRKKRIYDAVYRIEAEKNRRAHIGLVEFKSKIDHVRLSVQAQYEALCRRDEEDETCPNCGMKRMRVRTRPMLPFLEMVRNAPLGQRERRPVSNHKEVPAVGIAKEMNEAMRVIIKERRRFQLTGVREFIGPLPNRLDCSTRM